MSRENNTGRAGTLYPDNRNNNVFWFRIGLKDIWYLLALVLHQSAVILEKLGVPAIEKEERNIMAHLERLRAIKQRLIDAGDTSEHPMPTGYAASFRLQFTDRPNMDGGIGFGYYDQHCAGIIRQSMGLPVPHAQQQAGQRPARPQQPVQVQNWGTPVGIAPVEAPAPAPVAPAPVQAAAPANPTEAAIRAELEKAVAFNQHMQTMVAMLAAKIDSITK